MPNNLKGKRGKTGPPGTNGPSGFADSTSQQRGDALVNVRFISNLEVEWTHGKKPSKSAIPEVAGLTVVRERKGTAQGGRTRKAIQPQPRH